MSGALYRYDMSREELETIRAEFELLYAEHAKNYAGLDGTPAEIAELVKADRDGSHYRNPTCDQAWTGFQLAPVLSRMSTTRFLSRLSRDQLAFCVDEAKRRLEALLAVKKVKVWCVRVDDTTRYTATSAADAMDWLARFAKAFAAAPKEELLECSRRAVSIETSRLYDDELADWLKDNDKPEDFAKW